MLLLHKFMVNAYGMLLKHNTSLHKLIVYCLNGFVLCGNLSTTSVKCFHIEID